MLRTAFTPKWLGMLVVVVLVALAFIRLGMWQLGIAQGEAEREAIERARATAVVDVTSLLRPATPFPNSAVSARVSAVGEYAEGQFLVPNRRLGEQKGYWLVTPFVVASSGVRLPVLRGFTTKADALDTPPPTGRRTLVGGLSPSEPPVSDARPLPSGQLASIDASVLVNLWPGETYSAFVFLDIEDPEAPVDRALTRLPTPLGDTELQLRNAAYALQWWVFAGFALWLWWRMVRDAHRRSENGSREPVDPTPEH
ncbi:MAG: SURF1 family protein [Tetrasphaera sp.]|nr:SURF1 family protein [Tetrasphaera sp.]